MANEQKAAEQLAQENAELKAKLAASEEQLKSRSAGTLDEATEKEVRARMAAGLTREQALEVVRSQQAWDKDPANPKNAKAAK